MTKKSGGGMAGTVGLIIGLLVITLVVAAVIVIAVVFTIGNYQEAFEVNSMLIQHSHCGFNINSTSNCWAMHLFLYLIQVLCSIFNRNHDVIYVKCHWLQQFG